MDQQKQYRALLAVDIEASAGRGNQALQVIREGLFNALRESLRHSEIDWDSCTRHDLGDGLRVIAPAGTLKSQMIHPLLHELSVRLRAHNQLAAALAQIRVRVALHAGEVSLDGDGQATGQPLEVLARLLDATPVRMALTQSPQTVTSVAVLSQHFFADTVGHGYPGIDGDAFHRVPIHVKKYTADAWLYLPDPAFALPPTLSTPDDERPMTPTRPPSNSPDDALRQNRSTMNNKASGHGIIYATQNGTLNINPDDRT
ncbi:hypothetical protein [Nocardia sp. NPDC020380]|uniref:hypothetical protein n=1 Tax=Nocardia sp. NPDC020380 TaxID=3364309 RepID=UPI00379FABA2